MTASCAACGANAWSELPALAAGSVLSDGELAAQPLHRLSCLRCGLARHVRPPSAEDLRRLFGAGYGLYAHPPGHGREKARQQSYAKWISAVLGEQAPRTLLELGCGNGSLLAELGRLLPSARVSGVEPSGEAVREARAAGLDVRQGFAEDLAGAESHDAVLSVNVVEHAADPVQFLRALRGRLAPRGRALIACPDGGRAWVELLFFDHLHSLTESAFAGLLAQAGMRLLRRESAPAELGLFQLFVAEAADAPAPTLREGAAQALAAERARYLAAWSRLDAALLARLGNERDITAFGAGEAALLLRAYAREAWSRVGRLAVDRPESSQFAGLTVSALDGPGVRQDAPLLLAVRPQDQARLAQRLGSRFARIIRWDDLVAA